MAEERPPPSVSGRAPNDEVHETIRADAFPLELSNSTLTQIDLSFRSALRLLHIGASTRAFGELVRVSRNFPMSRRLAAYLVRMALVAKTLPAATALLRAGADDGEGSERFAVRRQLARLHRRSGQLDLARETLVTILADDPADRRARRVLNVLLEREERWEELDASLEKESHEALRRGRRDRAALSTVARARLSARQGHAGQAALRYGQAAQLWEQAHQHGQAFELRLSWLSTLVSSGASRAALVEALQTCRVEAERTNQVSRLRAVLRGIGVSEDGTLTQPEQTPTPQVAPRLAASPTSAEPARPAVPDAPKLSAVELRRQEAQFVASGRWPELAAFYRGQIARASGGSAKVELLSRLAEVLEDELHEKRAAAQTYGELVALQGELPALREQLRLLRELNDTEGISHALDRAIELARTPDQRADFHAERGERALATEDFSRAKSEFLASLRLQPRHLLAKVGLAEAAAASGELRPLRALLEPVPAISRKHPGRAELFRRLARLADRRDANLARVAWREVHSDLPEDEEAGRRLLTLVRQAGDDRALEPLLRAQLKRDPRGPEARKARVELWAALERLDRPAEALVEVRTAVRFEPGHKEAWLALADRCERLGQNGEAAWALEQAATATDDPLERARTWDRLARFSREILRDAEKAALSLQRAENARGMAGPPAPSLQTELAVTIPAPPRVSLTDEQQKTDRQAGDGAPQVPAEAAPRGSMALPPPADDPTPMASRPLPPQARPESTGPKPVRDAAGQQRSAGLAAPPVLMPVLPEPNEATPMDPRPSSPAALAESTSPKRGRGTPGERRAAGLTTPPVLTPTPPEPNEATPMDPSRSPSAALVATAESKHPTVMPGKGSAHGLSAPPVLTPTPPEANEPTASEEPPASEPPDERTPIGARGSPSSSEEEEATPSGGGPASFAAPLIEEPPAMVGERRAAGLSAPPVLAPTPPEANETTAWEDPPASEPLDDRTPIGARGIPSSSEEEATPSGDGAASSAAPWLEEPPATQDDVDGPGVDDAESALSAKVESPVEGDASEPASEPRSTPEGQEPPSEHEDIAEPPAAQELDSSDGAPLRPDSEDATSDRAGDLKDSVGFESNDHNEAERRDEGGNLARVADDAGAADTRSETRAALPERELAPVPEPAIVSDAMPALPSAPDVSGGAAEDDRSATIAELPVAPLPPVREGVRGTGGHPAFVPPAPSAPTSALEFDAPGMPAEDERSTTSAALSAALSPVREGALSTGSHPAVVSDRTPAPSSAREVPGGAADDDRSATIGELPAAALAPAREGARGTGGHPAFVPPGPSSVEVQGVPAEDDRSTTIGELPAAALPPVREGARTTGSHPVFVPTAPPAPSSVAELQSVLADADRSATIAELPAAQLSPAREGARATGSRPAIVPNSPPVPLPPEAQDVSAEDDRSATLAELPAAQLTPAREADRPLEAPPARASTPVPPTRDRREVPPTPSPSVRDEATPVAARPVHGTRSTHAPAAAPPAEGWFAPPGAPPAPKRGARSRKRAAAVSADAPARTEMEVPALAVSAPITQETPAVSGPKTLEVPAVAPPRKRSSRAKPTARAPEPADGVPPPRKRKAKAAPAPAPDDDATPARPLPSLDQVRFDELRTDLPPQPKTSPAEVLEWEAPPSHLAMRRKTEELLVVPEAFEPNPEVSGFVPVAAAGRMDERNRLAKQVLAHPLEPNGYRALAELFQTFADNPRSRLMAEIADALEGVRPPVLLPARPLSPIERAGLRHPSLRNEIGELLSLTGLALCRATGPRTLAPLARVEFRLDSGAGARALAEALLTAVRMLAIRAPDLYLSEENGPPVSATFQGAPKLLIGRAAARREQREGELRFHAARALFSLNPELLVLTTLTPDALTRALGLIGTALKSAQPVAGPARAIREALGTKGRDRVRALYQALDAGMDVEQFVNGAQDSANRAGLVVAGGVAPALASLKALNASTREQAELIRFAASERYLGIREDRPPRVTSASGR